MDTRFDALARATGGRRSRFTTLHTFVCEENGCDRPQLRRRRAPIRAHAQGSRYVVVVTKIVSSFRRGFIDASTSRRGAAFDGVEMEWISDARERATEPAPRCVRVGSDLTNYESSKPMLWFPSKTVPSRARVSRSVPFRVDATRTTSRDDASVSMRARIGANDFVPSHAVGRRVGRRARPGGRTNANDRSIDGTDGRDTLARYGFDRDLSVSSFDES